MNDWRSVLSEASPGDYGILGDPVEHSLSPAMQNAAFSRRLGNGGRSTPRYHRFHVAASDIAEFFSVIKAKPLAGMNVTVPYKRTVIPYLDKVDDLAAQLESVNTIRAVTGQLHGYSTDRDGFITSLKRLRWNGKSALVLGGGGTASTIVSALNAMELSLVLWWNRTPSKVLRSLEREAHGRPVFQARLSTDLAQEAKSVDMIVNATSVGLKDGDGLPADGLSFKPGQMAFDVVYHRETDFLKRAREAGALTCGGLPMLLYQGVAAFKIWTGDEAPVNEMKDALLKAVTEKGIRPVWPSAI